MAGQPTKYQVKYNRQAYKLCLMGATDADLAEFFEVVEATINNWKLEYPLFLESIKKGKELADTNVAESLYKRALGYSHKDSDIKVVLNEIVVTPLVKHYPPDTTAAIFWLKNRQPKKWRDKQEIDHTTGGESLNKKPDMSMLSDDEVRTMAEIQRKINGAK
jgi:hypothetical protein